MGRRSPPGMSGTSGRCSKYCKRSGGRGGRWVFQTYSYTTGSKANSGSPVNKVLRWAGDKDLRYLRRRSICLAVD